MKSLNLNDNTVSSSCPCCGKEQTLLANSGVARANCANIRCDQMITALSIFDCEAQKNEVIILDSCNEFDCPDCKEAIEDYFIKNQLLKKQRVNIQKRFEAIVDAVNSRINKSIPVDEYRNTRILLDAIYHINGQNKCERQDWEFLQVATQYYFELLGYIKCMLDLPYLIEPIDKTEDLIDLHKEIKKLSDAISIFYKQDTGRPEVC